jgi:hypothetical protein
VNAASARLLGKVSRPSENFRHSSGAMVDRGSFYPLSGENPPRSTRSVDGGRIFVEQNARNPAVVERQRAARTKHLLVTCRMDG